MNAYATLVADDAVRTIDDDARHRATAPPALPTPHVWVPWHCRNWPLTPAEEQQFVADLVHASRGDGSGHTRREVTAVLNALRGGLSVDDLLAKAPGLRTDRLLAAYHDLESRRAAAERAWWEIASDATPSSLRLHGPAAAELVPVLVDRLWAATTNGDEVYATVVSRLITHVEATDRDVHALESALATFPERGVELGARLYNPTGDAVTNRVDHVARRVGLLVPTRVAALLGESPNGAAQLGR